MGDFFIYFEEIVYEFESRFEGYKFEELEGIIDEFFVMRFDVEMFYINVEDFKIVLKKVFEG